MKARGFDKKFDAGESVVDELSPVKKRDPLAERRMQHGGGRL